MVNNINSVARFNSTLFIGAMGLSVSSLFSSILSLVRWSKDQDVRILMLGLDSAGKVKFSAVTHDGCSNEPR